MHMSFHKLKSCWLLWTIAVLKAAVIVGQTPVASVSTASLSIVNKTYMRSETEWLRTFFCQMLNNLMADVWGLRLMSHAGVGGMSALLLHFATRVVMMMTFCLVGV